MAEHNSYGSRPASSGRVQDYGYSVALRLGSITHVSLDFLIWSISDKNIFQKSNV